MLSVSTLMLLLAGGVTAVAVQPAELESRDPGVQACLQAAGKALELASDEPAARRRSLAGAVERCRVSRFEARSEVDVVLYTLGVLEQQRARTLRRDEVARERGFFWQEGAGIAVYEGGYLLELVTLFPDSALRDDALARLADRRYLFYECEGSESCRLINRVHALGPLLLRGTPGAPARLEALSSLERSLAALSSAAPEQPFPDPYLEAALATIDAVLEIGAGPRESRLRELLADVRAKLGS